MQRDLYVFCRSSPWLRGEVLLKAAVELGVHYADTSDERLDVMDFLFYLGSSPQASMAHKDLYRLRFPY